jgi:hypothetical protein
VAVFQDVTGKALEKAVAMSVAVGSGYTYESEHVLFTLSGARADASPFFLATFGAQPAARLTRS